MLFLFSKDKNPQKMLVLKSKFQNIFVSKTHACNATIRTVSIAVTTHMHQNRSGLWAVENALEEKGMRFCCICDL